MEYCLSDLSEIIKEKYIIIMGVCCACVDNHFGDYLHKNPAGIMAERSSISIREATRLSIKFLSGWSVVR